MTATPPAAAPDRPRFRESAAVVLVRGPLASREVFWVMRGRGVSYMPCFRAFVGGKVALEDQLLAFDDADAFDETERTMRACAIREAFEEAGVLVGLAAPVNAGELPAARERLLAGQRSFPALAIENGWRFRAGALTFSGRWQSPSFAQVRFDTMFFLAEVPADQEALVLPGELESGEWIAPAQGLERWRVGEEAFAAPILHVLRELDRGGDRLAERLVSGAEQAGLPVRRIELKWGIVLQPMKTRPLPPATHTNAYLVGEKEMALVDPGSGDPAELEALFSLVDHLAAEGRKLRVVLVTHGHSDHTAGVDAVRARYRAKVAAHRDIAPAVRADVALADGDWVPLLAGPSGDWNLRAIHTPGHARGHLCFHHPRTRSLFTGDHVTGGGGTVIIDPPEGDMAQYLRSLERLQQLEVDTIFPAHGAPQGGAARRIKKLVAHRLDREARVLAALEAMPLPLGDLLPRVYADVSTDLWRYAERSLLAHLLKLEAEGRAARAGEAWRRAAQPL